MPALVAFALLIQPVSCESQNAAQPLNETIASNAMDLILRFIISN
jgi:hypothetical protein